MPFAFSLDVNLSPARNRLSLAAVLVWACAVGLSMPVKAQTGWRSVAVPTPIQGSPGAVVAAPGGATPWASALLAPSAPSAQSAPSAVAAPTALSAHPGGAGLGGLQMFGVTLSAATRPEMRQAIRYEGLAVQREDEAFNEDIYEAPNLMPGLLQLKFTYAREGQRLAKVDYVFMTFSDNAHVEDVKLRIQGRFGPPAQVVGREEAGPYRALWRLPDQMEILVRREWPQKTTHLSFVNVPVMGQTSPDASRQALQERREQIQNPQALPTWVSR